MEKIRSCHRFGVPRFFVYRCYYPKGNNHFLPSSCLSKSSSWSTTLWSVETKLLLCVTMPSKVWWSLLLNHLRANFHNCTQFWPLPFISHVLGITISLRIMKRTLRIILPWTIARVYCVKCSQKPGLYSFKWVRCEGEFLYSPSFGSSDRHRRVTSPSRSCVLRPSNFTYKDNLVPYHHMINLRSKISCND